MSLQENNPQRKPLVKISKEVLEELKKQAVMGAAPSPYEQLMMQRRDPMQTNVDNLRKGMQNPNASIADRERMQRSIGSMEDQMGMRHANDPMYQRAQMETLRSKIQAANPAANPPQAQGTLAGETTGWRGDFAPQMMKRDHAEEVRPFQPRSAYDSGNYNRPGGSELGRQPLPVRSSVARVSQEAMPVNPAKLDPQYYSAKARGVQPPAPVAQSAPAAPAPSAAPQPPDMFEQAKQKLLASNKNLGVAGHADNTAFINSLKQNFGDNYRETLQKDPSKLMDLANNYKAPGAAPQPPTPTQPPAGQPSPGGNGTVNIQPQSLTSAPPTPAPNIPAPMQKSPNPFGGAGSLSLGGNAGSPQNSPMAPIKPENPIDASAKPAAPNVNPAAGNSKMAGIGGKIAELTSAGLPAMSIPAEAMDGMGGNAKPPRLGRLGVGTPLEFLNETPGKTLGQAMSRKGVAGDAASHINSMPGFDRAKPLLKTAPKYIASHALPIAGGVGDMVDAVQSARKGDTTGAVISGLGAMGTPLMFSGIPPAQAVGAALSFGAPIVNAVRGVLNEPSEQPVSNIPKMTPAQVNQTHTDQAANARPPAALPQGGSPRINPAPVPAPTSAPTQQATDMNSWLKQQKATLPAQKQGMLKAAEKGFKQAATQVGIEPSFANGMFEEVKHELFKQADQQIGNELEQREFRKQSKQAFDGFVEQLKKEGANQAFIEGFMKEANQPAPAPQGMPSRKNVMNQNRHNVVPGMNNNILGLGGGLLLGALANNMFDDDDDEPSPIRSIGMPLMGALLGHHYLPQLMNSWKDSYGSGVNTGNPLTAAHNRNFPVMGEKPTPISSPMSNPMVNPKGNVMTPNTPKTFPEFQQELNSK